LLQTGLVSSHFTFLFLQVRQPWEDFPLKRRMRLPPGEELLVELVVEDPIEAAMLLAQGLHKGT
jgi:hypothetical protein